MNESKKLTLSKETLRCLDDQDLTEVVGGHYSHNCFSGNCPSVQGNCVSVQGNCASAQAYVCLSNECSHAFICI
ncbi:MAG: class I lanthipeptide [Streptosporangiaceae bacterium]|nr:class I lanthipeptide [Streptosporangiaceae bacterium]